MNLLFWLFRLLLLLRRSIFPLAVWVDCHTNRLRDLGAHENVVKVFVNDECVELGRLIADGAFPLRSLHLRQKEVVGVEALIVGTLCGSHWRLNAASSDGTAQRHDS